MRSLSCSSGLLRAGALGLASLLLIDGCTPASPAPVTARAAGTTPATPVDAGADATPAAPTLGLISPWNRTRDLGPEELPDAAVWSAIDAVTGESASASSRAALPATAWDRKTPPKYLDRVIERYGLTTAERSLLAKSGMVVLSRVTFPSYGYAMHELHRQELPLYVTSDSLLQAVFRTHEALLVRAENARGERIGAVLDQLQKALVAERAAPSPRYAPAVARDAALYLGVARALLDGKDGTTEGLSTGDPEVDALVAKAHAASAVETVDLFGRPRVVDFTFYAPRGVYLGQQQLHGYFRAMVWLTRLELNLASRGSRSSAPALTVEETPREAALALALADLATRAGVISDVARLDAFGRKLAGRSEAVSLAELSNVLKRKSVSLLDADAAAATLRAELRDVAPRTLNYQVMPHGTSEASLPTIATFFGVAITADARSLGTLAPSDRPPHVPRGPELAYLLGADAGVRYVDPSGSRGLLQTARTDLAQNLGGDDVHTTWTRLVMGAIEAPSGVVPSLFATPAFADRRVSSGIAGYAQLHHAHVLHTAQAYDFSGCTIPDAYVEPTLGAYDATLAYTARIRELAALLGPSGDGEEDVAGELVRAAERLAKVARALRAVVVDELAGRPVSDKQLAFLRMVAEYIPSGGGYEDNSPGRFNGWYPAMHAERTDAFIKVPFSIDHFTSTRLRQIAYVGEGRPALGVFVVDVGGEPRVMLGPVTRAYDRVRPLGKRVAPAPEGGELGATGADAPLDTPPIAAHERSYVAPSESPPVVTVSVESRGALVEGSRALALTVELVDAHGQTLAEARAKAPGPTRGSDPPSGFAPFVWVGGAAREWRSYRVRTASGAVFDAAELELR